MEVRKMNRKRFETSPTHLEGTQLRKEPGIELDILRKTIEEFYDLAKNFAIVEENLQRLAEAKHNVRERIIKIVWTNAGLRGIISKKENFVLTVFPSEEVSWNRELLKKSLGIRYPDLVGEKLWFVVSIPVGYKTETGTTISEGVLEEAVVKALTNLGISTPELAKIFRKTVYLNVAEKKLDKLISENEIELQPGARKSEITWNVKVDPLKKFEAIKIAASS